MRYQHTLKLCLFITFTCTLTKHLYFKKKTSKDNRMIFSASANIKGVFGHPKGVFFFVVVKNAHVFLLSSAGAR